MSEVKLPNIPHTPITDNTGYMAIEWQNFFLGLFGRVGGADSITLDGLEDKVMEFAVINPYEVW